MKLVVSLHDVHPGSFELVKRQRDELRAAGIRRLSLLVVPNWHRREPVEDHVGFIQALSAWRDEGDEIVLHGWTHSCGGLKESPRNWFWTRLYTAGEAEFMLAGPDECRMRLATGRALFERLGWPIVGFIAPAWLMAPHTEAILQELGFAYTVTRTEIRPLGFSAGAIDSPSLCYSTRARWRRVASRVWNPYLERSLRRRPVMRLSIHPGDIVYPRIWRQVMRLAKRGVNAGRLPATYRECVASRIQVGASSPA